MRNWINWTAIGVTVAVVTMLGVIYRGSPGRSPVATYPKSGFPGPSVATYPDPNPARGAARVFLDPFEFDNGIFNSAARFTGEFTAASSLADYRKAIAGRVPRAMDWLARQENTLRLGPEPSTAEIAKAVDLCREAAFIALYDGDHVAAKTWLERGLEFSRRDGAPPEARAHLIALLGINALRRGEQENCIGCVGPSSCIFPIAPGAVHTLPSGSREAVRWFTEYLEEWPGDLRVRWLLNVASMTLGEYPDQVPPAQRIPISPPQSSHDPGRFENVASRVGLIARGPDLAGGSLFDDFTGDGLPDILTTSFDVVRGASLYVNQGDGSFKDRSESAGLADQVYALNGSRADYDNDGDLDVLLLRGAWEKPARMSLLRNKGDGTFVDVTNESGLAEPIASESGVWADYDNDGLLDLFVCGEYREGTKSRCRLYHNRGDGTFENVASVAGVLNERWAKGAAWGDYDNDGRIDLFVSNMGSPPRLYHNDGDGTFRDVAPALKITGSPHGFACLFWDYDNDGRLDILVTDWGGSLSEFVGNFVGLSVGVENHGRVYRNLGSSGFQEVSREIGLARPMPVMSANVGDIDNDGSLDLHLGTGWMSLSGLVPDLTYINAGGHFEDVTAATGTGHLQKGHGVSFADWDNDGDLDLFVVLGGGYPGDRGFNALFQNPCHERHWLKVRLVGTKSNRSAIGAGSLGVDLRGTDAAKRSVHRVIGNNGSFGGNTLVELIGLGDAAKVDLLSITWPRSGAEQTFRDVAADQWLEITEGLNLFACSHDQAADARPSLSVTGDITWP